MNKNKLIDIILDVITKEWGVDVEVNSTGTHADKSITKIKKELGSLEGKTPFNRERFSELMFALRAKQGWKQGKGATGTKEEITRMDKEELRELIEIELSEATQLKNGVSVY